MNYSKLKEASLRIGRSKDYFSVLKKTNPEAFKLVSSFDKDLYNSWNKWTELLEATRIEVENTIFEIEDTYGIRQSIGRFARDKGYYKHENTFHVLCSGKFGRGLNYISYVSDLKFLKIVKEYKEMKCQ